MFASAAIRRIADFVFASIVLFVLSSVFSPPGAQEPPKRLSDWLLEQPQSPDAYPLGLSWRVPSEVASQSLLRRDLMNSLSGLDRSLSADPRAVGRLRDWLRSFSVTGRVPVALADARWLQANPARDPVIQPGHTVILPSRPQAVAVITDQGDLCPVMHAPGKGALAYLEVCNSASAGRADWVWIAQPDGRVQRFGVALWNREAQDEPAPGAWIWGPARDGGWPETMSERLIRFLATQGPADFGVRAPVAAPQSPAARSRGLRITTNDWGGAGLLQTPSARMGNAGAFSFSLNRVRPYTWGNVVVYPFDWLEAGFRYIDVSNRLYGPADTSGTQSYKDKSFDAKFRLWPESASLPQLALGFRDLAGTGLFSGEYVVASKRTGPFDWSLGLGWGNLGARGDFKGAGTRKGLTGQGGNFGFSDYFRGPAALFGGVQYQPPGGKLTLKLELDGNNYRHEPQGNNQRQTSPLNIGMVYRASRSVDLSLGLERGNTLMFGVTLHTALDALEMPKFNDPPRIAVAMSRPAVSPDWQSVGEEIARQTGWHVRRIERRGGELRVTIDDPQAGYWRDRVDRVAAVLHRDAPAAVERFALAYRQGGVDVAEHVVDRETWVDAHTQALPPSERREAVIARATRDVRTGTERLYENRGPRFESGFGFNFRQTLGGPDGFILYQISAVERIKFRLREDTWLAGRLQLGLIDNYDKFTYTAPSNLPRVRTFLREYLTTSRLTLPNLQLTHIGKLGDNQYYSVYAGYLEEMFAGVGGEWLYRPFANRTALGIDVNAVRQRDFQQNLSFRDYRTVTGHATLYWDTGWQDVLAKLSAGRYLAKDSGVTLDLSRAFKNGVTVGAFFTKTTASAAQFGEGSFDKGVYISIPFDAVLTRSSPAAANFVWRPLTRDGGAKLARSTTLHALTNTRDERTLRTEAAPRPNEVSAPADRRERWQPAPAIPEPQLRLEPRASTTRWAQDEGLEFRLVQALHRQQFRNVEVAFDAASRLNVRLSNDVIRPISRAAGRAARTAARLAPLETREIRITIMDGTAPIVTYDFIDATRLERFFNGEIGIEELGDTVAVRYHAPGAREERPLALLGDLESADEPRTLGSLFVRPRLLDRVLDDFAGAARTARGADWIHAGLIAGGMLIGSHGLDQRVLRFASDHADSRWLKAGVKAGNAIPWIGFGAAALAALDPTDPRRSRTGLSAMEAGATAFLLASVLKPAIGRARPDAGLGTTHFKPFSTEDRYGAFPSRHAAVAWAVATPFALEYEAHWLYGVAAIANFARTGGRKHWLSDTVAGSLIGYGAGRIFWESSRKDKRTGPSIALDRSGVRLAWEWQ